MNQKLLGSIGAVVAGLLTLVLLSTVLDFALETIGIFPPMGSPYQWWMLGLALVYRMAFTVLGGYVTAALSGRKARRNVTILASIGLVAGILGIFVGWDLSDHWYPIAIAITAFPLTWLGGYLRFRRGY